MPESKSKKLPYNISPSELKTLEESQSTIQYRRLQEVGRLPPDEFLKSSDPFQEERLRNLGKNVAKRRDFI